jgi:hypothetical protein
MTKPLSTQNFLLLGTQNDHPDMFVSRKHTSSEFFSYTNFLSFCFSILLTIQSFLAWRHGENITYTGYIHFFCYAAMVKCNWICSLHRKQQMTSKNKWHHKCAINNDNWKWHNIWSIMTRWQQFNRKLNNKFSTKKTRLQYIMA